MEDNPYTLLDLDPRLDLGEITDLLRERAEMLPPKERGRLQELWRSLTMHREERITFALLTRPRVSTPDPQKLAKRLFPPNTPAPSVASVMEGISASDMVLIPRYTPPKTDAPLWVEAPLREDPFLNDPSLSDPFRNKE